MNSKQKEEERLEELRWKMPNINYICGDRYDKIIKEIMDGCSSKGILHGYDAKPAQYQIGIDTFARAEANMNFEEIMACCRFNIDKYTWRKKGQDIEDFKKIIAYAEFGIKQLEK